jgi:hypothetical protein
MSRRYLLAWLIVLLMPFGAWAQDEPAAEGAAAAETAEMPAATYTRYNVPDSDFSVELPDGGIITDPSDPDWNELPTVVFKWEATGDEPITLIMGRVDTFKSEVDDLTFNIVCGTMLEGWEEDKEAIQVVTANEPLRIKADNAAGGEQVWNLIEIADRSDSGGKTVYYSVFSTYAGENIYTITMYYLKPVDAMTRNFGGPVVRNFKLLGQPAKS